MIGNVPLVAVACQVPAAAEWPPPPEPPQFCRIFLEEKFIYTLSPFSGLFGIFKGRSLPMVSTLLFPSGGLRPIVP